MPHRPAPPTPGADPILVEAWRGDLMESVHRGIAVVADAAGRIVAAIGDADRPVYPRSAIKPLQALALVESGAADRFAVGEAELALAAASHSGGAEHVGAVAAWLARLGLSAADLECGTHAVRDPDEVRRLALAGEAPGPLHHNCSGKHAGMLTLARHLGAATPGYIAREHPAQRAIAVVLGEVTGTDAAHLHCAIDGCGVPTFAFPLSALATGMARLADPAGLAPPRAAACRRIAAAMAAHPRLVAGAGRLCTTVIAAAPQVLVKTGAEGVYAAALPALGLGLALKIDDGATRAAEVAVLALLARLGAFTEAQERALAPLFAPPVLNAAGRVVGALRAARE